MQSSDLEVVVAVAFVTAAFGALAGGVVTWRLNRSGWLRQARAGIYRGVLHEVHDWVHDVVVIMQDTKEPQGQPEGLGDRYSDLCRDATAASAEDGRKVEPFNDEWIEIGKLGDAWTKAKDGVDDREQIVAITRDFYQRQLVPWQNADGILNAYNEFLEGKLS